jgi:hypothetical protein
MQLFLFESLKVDFIMLLSLISEKESAPDQEGLLVSPYFAFCSGERL